MSGLRTGLVVVFCLSLFVEDVTAQPRGGIGDRDRGMLGRVGARRDERLNRNAPPPVGANPSAAANSALNPNLPPAARAANPTAGNGRTPLTNPATRPGIAPNLQALGYPNNSPYANRNSNIAQTPALVPQANSQAAGPRSAYYPDGANPNSRNAASTNPNYAVGPQAPASNVLPSGGVRPASASAPVNRLPYNGPGVLIRLPRTIPGEVNYLVDDSEHLIVQSGENQLLRLKGSYEVRFSRGVTSEGRSYGEARYTITEGVYRFDVSANGWELYREGEARDVEQAVAEAQQQAEEARREDEKAASESTRALNLRDAQAPARPSFEVDRAEENKPNVPPPSPAPSEETLPAPKSILEPS